jgi:hypothetical protein
MAQITNELKPPLDEALEHYGVKGMKWGVRRDQRTLDRAAGRPVSSRAARGMVKDEAKRLGTKNKGYRGMGKRGSMNSLRKGKDIRAARKRLKVAESELKTIRKAAKKTPSPENTAKLVKAQRDFDLNNDRVIASQLSVGEAAIPAILSLPVAGPVGATAVYAGAVTLGLLSSQKHQNRRWNIGQAEFMGSKEFKDAEKLSMREIEKARKASYS